MYKAPPPHSQWQPTTKDYVLLVFAFLGAMVNLGLNSLVYLPPIIQGCEGAWVFAPFIIFPALLVIWNIIVFKRLISGALNARISRFRFETLHIAWFWIFIVLSACVFFGGLSFFESPRC